MINLNHIYCYKVKAKSTASEKKPILQSKQSIIKSIQFKRSFTQNLYYKLRLHKFRKYWTKHLRNTNIGYGCYKIIYKETTFNLHPKQIIPNLIEKKLKNSTLSINAEPEYRSLVEAALKSAFRMHIVYLSKENEEFSKFYEANILYVDKHNEIIEKFWNLKNNMINESFKEEKKDLDDNTKKEFNDILKETLLNLRAVQLLSRAKNDDQKSTINAQNLVAHFKQLPELQKDIGLALNPGFKNNKLIIDEDTLYSESRHFPNYEGAGKIGFNVHAFSVSPLFNLSLKNFDLSMSWASKLTFVILPYKTINIHRFPLISGILYLQLPDIFKIFPRGLLEVDIFLGLGVNASYDLGVMPVSSVLFQLKITGVGFLQIEITKNINSTFIFWNKAINRTLPTSLEKHLHIHSLIKQKRYLEINVINISFGKDKQKHKTTIQKLLTGD